MTIHRYDNIDNHMLRDDPLPGVDDLDEGDLDRQRETDRRSFLRLKVSNAIAELTKSRYFDFIDMIALLKEVNRELEN